MVLGASQKNEIAKAAKTILKNEETRDILNLLFAKLMNGTIIARLLTSVYANHCYQTLVTNL